MTRFLLLAFIVTMTSSCIVLKEKRISYDNTSDLYVYNVNKNYQFHLRNEDGKLISDSNYTDFKRKLEDDNYTYSRKNRFEKSSYIKQSDIELVSQYSMISSSILSDNYELALLNLRNLKAKYSDITKYSDFYFLEGYCFENMDSVELSRQSYKNYLDFSSQKYSDRFRGYRYETNADSLWLLQRTYAHAMISGEPMEIPKEVFTPIKPEYYLSSFHPGFNLNREDLDNGAKGFLYLWLGYSYIDNFGFGVQTYHRINEYLDINPSIHFSSNSKGLSVAFPIQLYRSDNNRMGLKASPYFSINQFDSIVFENTTYPVEQTIFNVGAKISYGYYINQKLSLGAYYKYNLYNENNPFNLDKSYLTTWITNVYDLSLYYNLFKTSGLKFGFRNEGIVTGVYWSGLSISYDIINSEFIFEIEMF